MGIITDHSFLKLKAISCNNRFFYAADDLLEYVNVAKELGYIYKLTPDYIIIDKIIGEDLKAKVSAINFKFEDVISKLKELNINAWDFELDRISDTLSFRLDKFPNEMPDWLTKAL